MFFIMFFIDKYSVIHLTVFILIIDLDFIFDYFNFIFIILIN